MRLLRVFLFLLTLTAAHASSGGVYFVEWMPPNYTRGFLIPARESETPKEAVLRYRRSVLMDPELKYLHTAIKKWDGQGTIGRLKSSDSPQGAIIANEASDLYQASERIQRVTKPFENRQIKMLVIPPNAESGLSSLEAQRYRKLTAATLDLLHPVGGADINPALYGNQVTYAEKLNPPRDLSEYKLVREYYRNGGILFGICRGEQMIGVVAGCTLIQDVKKEAGVKSHRRPSGHRIFPTNKTAYARLLGTTDPTVFVSRHHQAVQPNPQSYLHPVAKAKDGIVEILEDVRGTTIGVQFHPEEMDESHSKALYDEIAARVRSVRRVSCTTKFKALAHSK